MKICRQTANRREDRGKDVMIVLKLYMTDEKGAETHASTSISFSGHVFNYNDQYKANIFVQIEKIEDQDILLRAARLSHLKCWRALSRVYGIVNSSGGLFATFQPAMIDKNLNKRLIRCVLVRREVLYDSATLMC